MKERRAAEIVFCLNCAILAGSMVLDARLGNWHSVAGLGVVLLLITLLFWVTRRMVAGIELRNQLTEAEIAGTKAQAEMAEIALGKLREGTADISVGVRDVRH